MTEMSPAEAIFFAALERTTPAERAAYLDAACTGQPALRERVEKLLAAHPRVGEFLEPAAAPEVTGTYAADKQAVTSDLPNAVPGVVIAGKYKLLQQIGEGGMGTVWMADQTEPVKRRVAVKLIRVERGSSATILARFEAERQAIALMDHPHIAKLLDAGTTDAGQPYFVMELVKGIPLTEYCDAHRLSVQDRLGLFQQICSAVQHAHQKGIIHRDLKPTNILVESHDDKPVPKVIDFGLAKATSGMQLTEHTLFTGFGTVMGTPLYMAPEQAKFNAVDIDTRADIYALGVILYELLTGTTPLTRETIKKAALDEMLRLIREQEAPTPSSRLSTSDSKPSVAANRQTEPAKLGRFVKGELDWIVLKALAKERDRRYETANGFARDIEKFLNHEPVAAGPPSTTYKLRKFVRRNRGQVIAASLLLFALVSGIAGTTIGLIEAKRQERLAVEARKGESERAEAEVLQRMRAEEAERVAKANELRATDERNRAVSAEADTKAFSDFLVNRVLSVGRPTGQDGGLGVDVKVSQAIKAAEKSLETDFHGRPLAEAVARHAIGVTHYYLGEDFSALVHLRQAVKLRTDVLGPADAKTLEAKHDLALVLVRLHNAEEALPLFQTVYEESIKVHGPTHRDTLSARMNLGDAFFYVGQVGEAIRFHQETIETMTAVFGPNDKYTLFTRWMLARAYGKEGGKSIEIAVTILEETLRRASDALGANNPATLAFQQDLGRLYLQAGRRTDAIRTWEGVIRRSVTVRGPDHSSTHWIRNQLTDAYLAEGRANAAVPLLDDAYSRVVTTTGRSNAPYRAAQFKLIKACEAAGRWDVIVRVKQEELTDLRKGFPAGHLIFASRLDSIGLNLTRLEKWEEAATNLTECLAIRTKHQPDSWETFNTQSLLGGALLGQKKYADAEPLLLAGYAGVKLREKTIPPQGQARLPEAVDRLIELYTATNKPDEAKKWQAERAKYPEIAPPPRPRK